MEKYYLSNEKKTVWYEWNEVSKPTGIIQIAHGMVEYACRYDNIAKKLNEAGFIVAADDHRGHGATDRDNLGYCKGDMFFDTAEDMKLLTDTVKNKYPGLPYILFGFSYGSFLTQYYIGKYMNGLNGVIIGGSSKQKKLMVAAGRAVAGLGCIFKGEKREAQLIKKLTFGSYDKKFEDGVFLSTDKKNNERYFSDPLCSFVCSNNFYRSFFKGLSSLYGKKYKNGLNKDVPVLIISGKDDPVGDMGSGPLRLFEFYKKCGLKNVELKLYENSRHEFLNEAEGPERLNDIIAFCRKCLDNKV